MQRDRRVPCAPGAGLGGRRSLDPAAVARGQHCLGAVDCADLAVDVVEVGADRRDREVHFGGDLLVDHAFGEVAEDVELAGGEGARLGDAARFGARQGQLVEEVAEGLDAIFHRHRLLAETIRSAVARWSEAGTLAFNITTPAERSDTVTAVKVDGAPGALALKDFCRDTCGVVLGNGIGALAGQGFRIAHMGHVNAPMILGTLGVVETALRALGIPHGHGGTSAAIDWLGQNVGA